MKDRVMVLPSNGFQEGPPRILYPNVAIAGGLSLKADQNVKVILLDPLLKNGLGGGVRYLALQHLKTARE